MRNLTLYFLFFAFVLPSFSQPAENSFKDKLIDAALYRTEMDITYDPSYYSIDYPNGDVPKDKGVCTDVIIRSYRELGIDLQQLVHEDMKANFSLYPDNWGLPSPDKNIDHRRVPNLMVYFSRYGTEKPKSKNPNDYQPGDIVCWNLGGGITHIGILTDKKSNNGKRYLAVHNIGGGPELSDCLFEFEIIGHYAAELKINEAGN